MTLLAALETSLAAVKLQPQDEALAALLRAYARDLDGAARLATEARKLAREVARFSGEDGALYERVEALERALGVRAALDRIGARYHAGLVEMLATPRARAAGKPAGAEPADGGKLGQLLQLSTGESA